MSGNGTEIVSIGEELLLGDIADTNAAWIAGQLASIGLPVDRVTVCGDSLEAIEEVLRPAVSRARLVVVTGGLGPTEDDLTRFGIAAVAGRPLVLCPDLVEHIRCIFQQFGRPMPPSNEVQAMMPDGADVIENPNGTAAGFTLRIGGCLVAVFPGVPGEMKPMVTDRLLPMLVRSMGRGNVLVARYLHVFGLGESSVNEQIADLMAPRDDSAVGLMVSDGVITVRITAFGGEDEARRLLDVRSGELRARLGAAVFGCDGQTLQEVVGQALIAAGVTIALAESCTAGLISSRLGEVTGISASLLSALVTYDNAEKSRLLNVEERLIKEHGAVSPEVAAAMAVGARAGARADMALSVTGIAGPTGGSAEKPVGLVYFGLADAGGVHVERRIFRGGRNQIRDRAAKTALNLLRLYLAGGSPCA